MLKWIYQFTHHQVVGGRVVMVLVLAAAYPWPVFAEYFVSGLLWLVQSSAIPNWMFVAMVVLSVSTIWVSARSLWLRITRPSEAERLRGPEFFLGLNWRWGIKSLNGTMIVFPFRPQCDMQIMPVIIPGLYPREDARYSCPNCSSDNFFLDAPKLTETKVILEIQRQLRQRGAK